MVWSRIGWLQHVGWLREFESAQQLVQDIMSGPDGSGGQQPPEERSSVIVRREVYSAICRGDEGLEHLASQVPPEWADMFAAAREWREKMLSVPIPTLAQWVRAIRALRERDAPEEIDVVTAEHLGPHGIGEPLLERVVGPDRAVLTSEEGGWMLYAPLQDDYCSRWTFEVQEEVRKLDETEGGK